jgi:hypothetical protein
MLSDLKVGEVGRLAKDAFCLELLKELLLFPRNFPPCRLLVPWLVDAEVLFLLVVLAEFPGFFLMFLDICL